MCYNDWHIEKSVDGDSSFKEHFQREGGGWQSGCDRF